MYMYHFQWPSRSLLRLLYMPRIQRPHIQGLGDDEDNDDDDDDDDADGISATGVGLFSTGPFNSDMEDVDEGVG